MTDLRAELQTELADCYTLGRPRPSNSLTITVVHRDIKPQNLLLTTDGNTLVADFGIARSLPGEEHRTQTGLSVGTPAYMSPEQASGDKALDARTDVPAPVAGLRRGQAGHLPTNHPGRA